MAAPLSEYFVVCPSDIHPFGFGDVVDFLDEGAVDPECDWIVSNPPFKTAEQFVRLALRRARRGVAMLLRLQFLETESRFDLFYGEEPLTACAVFAERVSMFLGCWDPSGSSLATGYAWFFWMKGAAPRPMIGIPPGTKQRLTRRDDAERFGLRRPAGLLDAMEAAE
jgi:hypothetical protein